MRTYFDAHVYVANWGTHRFMLKIPRDLLDVETAELYCGECLDMYVGTEHVILDFGSQDESDDSYDDWDSGEGWMASLLPLREEIMQGDVRALYVAWLAGVWEDDETEEPPMPPGVSQLSGPSQQLARFLCLDERLLQAAVQDDTQTGPVGPSREEMATWVASNLPSAEKDALLVALLAADAEVRSLAARVRQRFQQEWRQTHPAPAAARSTRTADQLWHVRNTLAAESSRREAEEAARQRAERERKAAAERRQYLTSLATREASAWQEVNTLLSTTVQKNYDEAVTLLRDLHDVATDRGDVAQWEARVADLRQRYARKSSLMQRFTKAGLPG